MICLDSWRSLWPFSLVKMNGTYESWGIQLISSVQGGPAAAVTKEKELVCIPFIVFLLLYP